MLSEDENRLLTGVGPGTPMGEVLRRYWHPVAFSELMTAAPRAVKLLGVSWCSFAARAAGPASAVDGPTPVRGQLRWRLR